MLCRVAIAATPWPMNFGLLVNLVCAWLLKDEHGHVHHHDLNLPSALVDGRQG